jgi:type IV pilus assembly protein PilE
MELDAMRRRGTIGFTLIELLIVVAIVGILATIAYPKYEQQMHESWRAEGKATLVEMAQALEKCKILYGQYDSPGAAPYNCAAVTAVTGGGVSSPGGHYQVTTSAIAASTFTLQAVPQHTDSECGTLTIDQVGDKTESGTGALDDCW